VELHLSFALFAFFAVRNPHFVRAVRELIETPN
jgi:hypothetical protein